MEKNRPTSFEIIERLGNYQTTNNQIILMIYFLHDKKILQE